MKQCRNRITSTNIQSQYTTQCFWMKKNVIKFYEVLEMIINTYNQYVPLSIKNFTWKINLLKLKKLIMLNSVQKRKKNPWKNHKIL